MRLTYKCILILLFVYCAYAQDAREQTYDQRTRYLQISSGGLTTRIEPYGKHSLRVRVAVGDRIYVGLPGALVPLKDTEGDSEGDLDISQFKKSIRNGNLKAVVGRDGLLTFTRVSDSTVILRETLRKYAPSPYLNGTYVWNVSYASDPSEAIYGLGEHRTGRLNNKGFKYDFKTGQIYDYSFGATINIPFYVSNNGYGYLWNLPSFGGVALNSDNTSWSSESAYQLDFWVTTTNKDSSNPYGDILSHYVDATGHSPKIPYFGTGFWQSANRYRNQSHLLNVAYGHVQRGLPISLIVIDRLRDVPFGDFTFNPLCWPDPVGMTDQLAALGINTMVSIWPLIQANSVNFLSFTPYFVRCPATADLCLVPPLPVYTIDNTIPNARSLLWNKVYEGFYKRGVTSYFLDSAEPVHLVGNPRYFYSIGPEETVGLIYPILYAQAFTDGLASANGSNNGIALSRSAWAGYQRLGAAVWSGDINSTFESLSEQVRVGLNMGLSGIIWWTTDIGGYFNGNIYSDYFRELIVRWFQWGAFCPIFRNHGFRDPLEATDADVCGRSGSPNEIWEFGPTAYNAIATVMHIREQLRPYIKEQFDVASKNGTPVMRPLWFDFPNDTNSANIEDQFMFGPTYMVAPVLQYLARSRSVYFPVVQNNPAAVWEHWFTRATYAQGTTEANFPADINTFPLFFLRSH